MYFLKYKNNVKTYSKSPFLKYIFLSEDNVLKAQAHFSKSSLGKKKNQNKHFFTGATFQFQKDNRQLLGLIKNTKPEQGNGSPLQYSCLGNPMDRGACRARVMDLQRFGHDQTHMHAKIPKIYGKTVYEYTVKECFKMPSL